jgi:hypothetical protein
VFILSEPLKQVYSLQFRLNEATSSACLTLGQMDKRSSLLARNCNDRKMFYNLSSLLLMLRKSRNVPGTNALAYWPETAMTEKMFYNLSSLLLMLRTNRNVPGTNALAYFSGAKMWKKKSFVSLTPDFIPSDVFLFSFAKKKSWESFFFLPQKSNNLKLLLSYRRERKRDILCQEQALTITTLFYNRMGCFKCFEIIYPSEM